MISEKFAVTLPLPVIVNPHWFDEGVGHPVQLTNRYPAAGVAVSQTTVP